MTISTDGKELKVRVLYKQYFLKSGRSVLKGILEKLDEIYVSTVFHFGTVLLELSKTQRNE